MNVSFRYQARRLSCSSLKVYLSSPSCRHLPKERSVLLPLYALILFTLFVDVVTIYDFDGDLNRSDSNIVRNIGV